MTSNDRLILTGMLDSADLRPRVTSQIVLPAIALVPVIGWHIWRDGVTLFSVLAILGEIVAVMGFRARCVFLEEDEDAVVMPVKYEFDGFEFHLLAGGKSFPCRWSEVRRVEETAERFFLWTGSLSYHVLPKRLLDGEDERRFRELARAGRK